MARGKFGYSGVYNATAITLDDQEGAALALDVSGRVIMGLGGANAYAIDDSAMPATPSILPVGGEYRSSATTYTDGDATVLQTDVNGNLKVTNATLQAGEDLTNDVQKVEQRFNYLNIVAGQATTVVKASSGFLHAITFNGPATATNTTNVYDHASGSGTIIATPLATAIVSPTTVIYDVSFATGLTIITATANGANMTISYR